MVAVLFPVGEIPQVGRRLPPSRRHQAVVITNRIGLRPYRDVPVGFGAYDFIPLRIALALVSPRYGPRPGQRMVDGRDLIAQEIRIVFVETDALLHDSFVVLVHRKPAAVEHARTFDAAGLDDERVVTAVPDGIFPRAYRIARMGRLELLGPLATVSVDPTNLTYFAEHDIGGVRHDNDFHWTIADHRPRHARRNAD